MLFRKKKLYLHIGLHKTGTTSLQSFLRANRQRLLHDGYLYPEASIPENSSAHHLLAWKLANLAQAKAMNARDILDGILLEQKREGKNLVLSSEDFSRLGPDKIKELRSMFSRFSVKVLVHLRRQDYRLESYYIQRVRGGTMTTDFKSYIEETKEAGDYYRIVERWSDVFGKDNLVIRVVDRMDGDVIYADFLRILGLPEMTGYSMTGLMNVSPDANVAELLRRLNMAFVNGELNCDVNTLKEKYKLPLIEKMGRGRSEVKISYWEPLERRKLLDHFRVSNENLATAYLGTETLFTDEMPATVLPGFRAENIELEEVLRIIRD